MLAALPIVVLPFGRAVEVPVMLMAALGLWMLLRNPRNVLNDPGVRLLSVVFLCAWVPIVASWPDAISPQRTAVVVLNHLRFWLSGVFIIAALGRPRARVVFLTLIGAVLAVWVADAIFQHFVGHDIFGYKAYGSRLGAMFGPGNSKFGLTLAVFAPLLWHVLQTRFGNSAAAIAIVVTVAVVFLAGSRAGWVCVLVAAGSWVLLRSQLTGKRAVALVLALLLATVVGTGIGYATSSSIAARIDKSLVFLTAGPENAINNSLTHRIWIWGAALRMIEAHPVNGVGARGFRNAFAQFARDDDPYLKMDPPQSPTHSHQLIIEVLAETGLIGLVGLLALWLALANAYRRADAPTRALLAAPAAAIVAAYFPLNTHLAIFGSYWSQIVWFLVAIYCASLVGKDNAASSADSAARTRSEPNQRS